MNNLTQINKKNTISIKTHEVSQPNDDLSINDVIANKYREICQQTGYFSKKNNEMLMASDTRKKNLARYYMYMEKAMISIISKIYAKYGTFKEVNSWVAGESETGIREIIKDYIDAHPTEAKILIEKPKTDQMSNSKPTELNASGYSDKREARPYLEGKIRKLFPSDYTAWLEKYIENWNKENITHSSANLPDTFFKQIDGTTIEIPNNINLSGVNSFTLLASSKNSLQIENKWHCDIYYSDGTVEKRPGTSIVMYANTIPHNWNGERTIPSQEDYLLYHILTDLEFLQDYFKDSETT